MILAQIIITASDNNTDPTITKTWTSPLYWSFCGIGRFVVFSKDVVIGDVIADVDVEVSSVDVVLVSSGVYNIISVALDSVFDSIVISTTAEPVNGRSPLFAAVTLKIILEPVSCLLRSTLKDLIVNKLRFCTNKNISWYSTNTNRLLV